MLGLGTAGAEKEQDPTEICDDCGVADGQLHDLFCTRERCPFCGHQLITCDCVDEVLHLTPEEKKAREDYIDDSVEPLKGIMERWKAALRERGRIPFRGRKLEATADDLILMAARGELEAVKKLLALGVAVDATNKVNYTALKAAARSARVDLVQHLLKRGADPRHRDIYGHTALHLAVGAPPYGTGAINQAECVELLLKAGADLKAETNDGGTALSSAAWFGCAPAVEVLLKAGADPTGRDKQGRTPADLARTRGHEELAQRLS
jgi:hypothetical protein